MKLRRLGALGGAFLLTFGMVSSVFADAANPETVVAEVDGLTVTLSGTWTWQSRGDSCTDRWVGWAVDWGDPNATGHEVPIKDSDPAASLWVGTPEDNTVHHNSNCGEIGPDNFPIGTWGEISHTYSVPGEYHVCVVTYDIHLQEGQPKNASELVAGGDGNNKDNSAQTNGKGPGAETGVCIPATIVVTPSPEGSVGGETNVPTGPPTDAITGITTDAGGALPLLLLVLGVIGVGAVVLTPRRGRR